MADARPTVKIKMLRGSARMPSLASVHSAGVDLYACEDFTLLPGARAVVPTGVALGIPLGFEGQVRPRSGLAAKHGVTVLNAPGCIDSDYRGEVGVVLINHGRSTYHGKTGDRIAQLVIAPVALTAFEVETGELTPTDRGANGFGSSGR